jgi:hypothetical protein
MAGRCPLCGVNHSACGQRTTTEGIIIGRRVAMSGALKRYDVEINGVKTTLQLSVEDAEARGFTKADDGEKSAPAPANKSRRAPNKSAAKS